MQRPRITSPGSSFRNYLPYTPDDDEEFEDAEGNVVVAQAVFVGDIGDIALINEDGNVVILPQVYGMLFITARGVKATGTTAGSISYYW
jgi:hypothetical protein